MTSSNRLSLIIVFVIPEPLTVAESISKFYTR